MTSLNATDEERRAVSRHPRPVHYYGYECSLRRPVLDAFQVFLPDELRLVDVHHPPKASGERVRLLVYFVSPQRVAGLDPEQRLRFRELVSNLPNRPAVLLSTHVTEDVTALCERVIVVAGGTVRFDGSTDALSATAQGRVWVAEAADARAVLSWRMGDGRHRHIGDPPAGAELTTPTVDDAYLLMVGGARDGREMAA